MNNIIRETLISKKVTQEMIENETICPICLNNFEEGDTFIKLPCKSLDGFELNHCFHINCEKCTGIDIWLNSHSTCPCCRYDFNINQNEEVNLQDNLDELIYNINYNFNYINYNLDNITNYLNHINNNSNHIRFNTNISYRIRDNPISLSLAPLRH